MQADGHDDWQRGESAFRELKTAVKMVSDRDLTARFDDIDVQLFRVEREYDAEIHISTFTREDGDSPVSGNRYVFHADGRVDVTSSDDGHATKTVIDGLLDGAIHPLLPPGATWRFLLPEAKQGGRSFSGRKKPVRPTRVAGRQPEISRGAGS